MALTGLHSDREFMPKAVTKTPNENEFLFGSDFLHDHVGQIIDEPTVAVLELIANCYDAGANRVEVKWPSLPGETLTVSDNGIGMTREEFETRWRTLKYDRIAVQGTDVVFPSDTPSKKRTAFGHNGKGRFSPLCFSDEYRIETWRDGKCTTAIVELTSGGSFPFRCKVQSEKAKSGHGTVISTTARRNILPAQAVCDLIGFKFSVDPSFIVKVNGYAVKLLSLSGLTTDPVERNTRNDLQDIPRGLAAGISKISSTNTVGLSCTSQWKRKKVCTEQFCQEGTKIRRPQEMVSRAGFRQVSLVERSLG
jgi:hypothetical protein